MAWPKWLRVVSVLFSLVSLAVLGGGVARANGEPGSTTVTPAPVSRETDEFTPIRAAALSKPARIAKEFRPTYPAAAKRAGVEGVVVLRVQVTRDGRTRKVKVVEGLHPDLDTASMEALRKFEWLPAEVDGEPVDAVITYRFNWELYEGESVFLWFSRTFCLWPF